MIKTIASKLNLKRPKIVEQIVVVLFFAVLIPFVTIGFIISNVSQHTIRKELNYSATMLAQYVGENASLYHKLAPKDFESFDVILNKKLSGEKREVFVIDEKKNIVATNAKNIANAKELIGNLPLIQKTESPELYGHIKNQPMAYYKLKSPEWTVIVNTTEKITKNTINIARFKIILSLLLSMAFIFFIVGLYVFYLYLNMRQLLKGVTAISKGNYERKIRLIKNIFSPYEMYFLTKEFNYMARKISTSYKDLSKKNLELERSNEFRSNLVSAISHEFRTPLTSIIGYSSRLMRQDIELDDATKNKSLKIIKEQAQLLSRMVEDLLVVPEIESYSLKLNNEPINIIEVLEKAIIYTNPKNHEINVNIEDDIPYAKADEDRLLQVLLNLVGNAIKYTKDEEPIEINAKHESGKIIVEISNPHEKIEEKMLATLCDKFIRADSELTRTTRGTGLGLYIVKGLTEAMNIGFEIKSEEGKFTTTLIFESCEQWTQQNLCN